MNLTSNFTRIAILSERYFSAYAKYLMANINSDLSFHNKTPYHFVLNRFRVLNPTVKFLQLSGSWYLSKSLKKEFQNSKDYQSILDSMGVKSLNEFVYKVVNRHVEINEFLIMEDHTWEFDFYL